MNVVRTTVFASALAVLSYGSGLGSGFYLRSEQFLAKRMNSDGRFAQLALALHNYYEVHGHFPPLTWSSQEKGPKHSWRVALLPFTEQQSFFDPYDSSEPWNSEQNLKLSRELTGGVPGWLTSPFAEDCTKGATNYVAVNSATKKWPRGRTYARRHMVVRGSDSFIIVEIPESEIHWMEPRDTPLSDERSETMP